MPTPAAIITRICSEAKLNGASGSADRALCLSWLQEAADRACNDAQVPVTSEQSVTLTQGDATYTLDASPFPTDMIGLLEVSVNDAALNAAPVVFVTPMEMQAARQGGTSQAQGTPQMYSGDWPNIVLWPPPGAATTLTITYLASAPTLADDATAISVFPPAFQWGCLYELAMMRALKYKGRQEDAKGHGEAYEKDRNAGLPALRRWVGSAMGRQGAVQPTILNVAYAPSQDTGF